MRYELLLQPAAPGAPYEPGSVEALLREQGLVERPDGTRLWRLKSGEVEVEPVTEGGRQVATGLRIPLRAETDLVREALVAGAALAEQARVRLFDLQLLREVQARDEGAVVDQYLRTARYAGEMMGVSEALWASIPPPDDRLLSPGVKVALGVIAAFVALYLLIGLLVR